LTSVGRKIAGRAARVLTVISDIATSSILRGGRAGSRVDRSLPSDADKRPIADRVGTTPDLLQYDRLPLFADEHCL
jgi:hypothetical protein